MSLPAAFSLTGQEFAASVTGFGCLRTNENTVDGIVLILSTFYFGMIFVRIRRVECLC